MNVEYLVVSVFKLSVFGSMKCPGTSTKIRYVPYCETTLNIFTALREGVMAG